MITKMISFIKYFFIFVRIISVVFINLILNNIWRIINII